MKTTAERNAHIQKILNFLEKVYINPQVEGFVDSVRDFFNERGYLTDKQYQALMNIYERV
jgi:ferritin